MIDVNASPACGISSRNSSRGLAAKLPLISDVFNLLANMPFDVDADCSRCILSKMECFGGGNEVVLPMGPHENFEPLTVKIPD